MKMFRSKYVIWEMDVGLTTTLRLKFKLVNTGHQKLLSEQIMTLQQMYGVLLAQSLRW